MRVNFSGDMKEITAVRMKTETGFSLIELLIVVAIILIIAAIAVPNLLRAKMAANEAAVAAADRTIGTANITYHSAYSIGFAGTLGALGPPAAGSSPTSANADLLDSVLAGGIGSSATSVIKNGYTFTYAAAPGGTTPTQFVPNETFSVLSVPVSAGSSGTSTFCIDQTNLIKKDTSGASTTAAATGCATFSGGSL
jgi:type IV pilus assembly protein PilA